MAIEGFKHDRNVRKHSTQLFGTRASSIWSRKTPFLLYSTFSNISVFFFRDLSWKSDVSWRVIYNLFQDHSHQNRLKTLVRLNQVSSLLLRFFKKTWPITFQNIFLVEFGNCKILIFHDFHHFLMTFNGFSWFSHWFTTHPPTPPLPHHHQYPPPPSPPTPPPLCPAIPPPLCLWMCFWCSACCNACGF